MPDVVALGEPMVEYCATTIGNLSKVDLFKRGWGGDTSNFAVSASRQGLSVGHICRLGDDEFGRSFLDLWESEARAPIPRYEDALRLIREQGRVW